MTMIHSLKNLAVHVIPVLEDNYSFFLRELSTGKTAVVDPAEAVPIARYIDQHGGQLDFILNTHHHRDHTGGNLALKERYQAKVLGPASDASRIPGMDSPLIDRQVFALGESRAQIFHIPGHTSGHTALWFAEEKALFCGDTLFTLGCGFLFEGTPEQMWTSLSRLRDLPDDAWVFCGHEYTLENAEFAVHFDGENPQLQSYVRKAQAKRATQMPTVPSRLGDEKSSNPFLRADHPEIAIKLGLTGGSPAQVFAEIRRLKNEYDDAKRAARANELF